MTLCTWCDEQVFTKDIDGHINSHNERLDSLKFSRNVPISKVLKILEKPEVIAALLTVRGEFERICD